MVFQFDQQANKQYYACNEDLLIAIAKFSLTKYRINLLTELYARPEVLTQINKLTHRTLYPARDIKTFKDFGYGFFKT